MKVSKVTSYLLCGMVLAAGILFFVENNALAEDVTITTYYPAPYGVYDSLLTDKLGVGDNDGDGNLTSADVPANSGEVWIEGNVGIGTADPNDKLHVAGHINADAGYSYRFRNRDDLGLYEDGSYGLHISAPESIAINIDSNNNAGDIFFAIGRDAATANPTAGNTLFYINESGKVGIGTTNPQAQLHVTVTDGKGCLGFPMECLFFDTETACEGQSGCSWVSGSCHHFFSFSDCMAHEGCEWDMDGFCFGDWGSCEGTPTACSSFGESGCPGQDGCHWGVVAASAIFESGVVGIGTTNPDPIYSLHVVGRCGGSDTCNQDIAEVFSKAKDESLEPGDVVVLSGTDRLNLYKSRKPYDTNIAGVYSTDPGMLIRGEEGIALSMGPQRESEFSETQLPLALVGKTLVKVTNENGPIKKGDLLTTSSTPGHAMRCPVETNEQKLKCMGAILGKALEPCDEPTSKILTLISLQ